MKILQQERYHMALHLNHSSLTQLLQCARTRNLSSWALGSLHTSSYGKSQVKRWSCHLLICLFRSEWVQVESKDAAKICIRQWFDHSRHWFSLVTMQPFKIILLCWPLHLSSNITTEKTKQVWSAFTWQDSRDYVISAALTHKLLWIQMLSRNSC